MKFIDRVALLITGRGFTVWFFPYNCGQHELLDIDRQFKYLGKLRMGTF